MDLGLNGKKAIVTASSRGIGRAVALVLADEGADIAICARSGDELARVAGELEARGARVFSAALDVSHASRYRAFIGDAAEAMGGLDIFIHNVSAFGGFEEEEWNRSFQLDVMGAVRGVEECLPYLERSVAGSIVFNGTVGAVEAFPGISSRMMGSARATSYGPLKAALWAYANELAQELAPKGIRVNTVDPGAIYDGVWQQVEQMNPEVFEYVRTSVPLGRYGSGEEAARVFAFVASPAASFVTGTHVIVDGGLHKGIA